MLEDRPRVLHASLLPHISRGIASQLLLEKKAARDLGIPWETELFSPRSSLEPFPEPLNAQDERDIHDIASFIMQWQ